VLFFKPLHALAHFLTSHRQEGLLQRQFHMRIGQRFFSSAQVGAELGGFVYFMGFFHANDHTKFATAKLPHPPHDRSRTFNPVFTPDRDRTGFS